MPEDISKTSISRGGGKEPYIEYIRAFAALTVVLLHIVMTLPANYSVDELGVFTSIVFNCVYMPTKWAVPCFVMVSGALLLNPDKEINTEKIFKYISRMLLVLVLFGTCFALMEIVFSEKTISVSIIFRALLNVAEQKSWSHLWYIYVLISLYILTIPLKYAIQKMNRKELDYLVIALVLGNFVIPAINTLVGTEIYSFMILTEYTSYYLIGYWITTKKNIFGYKVILFGVAVTIVMCVTEAFSLRESGVVYELNHQAKDILTFVQSVSVFLFFREIFKDAKLGKMIVLLSSCSFAIYIIHPFWINMIYKVFKITPLSMPIGLGIIVLWIMVALLSIGSSMILKRIPIIKRII